MSNTQSILFAGRPWKQSGEAPVALARERSGASSRPRHPKVGEVSAAHRTIAGAFWLRAARNERASVASFNRFALELMALGAPAELLLGAQRAALEEIGQAQACFALAELLSGRTLSPGQMDLRVERAGSMPELAAAVAREAAINGTLGAFQAAFQLRQATDPRVVPLLRRILLEEAHHAELAWATLRWLLEAGGEPVRDRLVAVFSEAIAPSVSDFPEEGVAALGVPPRWQMRRALECGAQALLRPCVEALLQTHLAATEGVHTAFTDCGSTLHPGPVLNPIGDFR